MQWCFSCCESDLEDYYWRYSFYELKKRIELRVGEVTASHMSFYSSLVEVASAAFGSKSEDKPKPKEDLSIATPEVFAARVNQLLAG